MSNRKKMMSSTNKTMSRLHLPIIFDTSILRGIKPNDPSPEFRLLQRLARANKITLLMPDMVSREWLSQRAEPSLKAIDQLSKAIDLVLQNPSLASQPEIDKLRKLYSKSKLNMVERVSEDWHNNSLNNLGLETIAFQPDDARLVIDDYFAGKPPFAGRKSRNDFPDAFVLASVKSSFADDERCIFVCNDVRLRQSAEHLGISTAESLADLLKLKAIASLHSNAEFALWWEQHFRNVVEKLEHDESLSERAESSLIDPICNRTISHYSIPEDNNEAYVQSAGAFADFDYNWAGAESLGEGLLSIPITFTVEIEMEFSVYRSDAYNVPDWVDVSIGDFEEEHYFEASGSRRAQYEARIVLEIGDDIMKDNSQINMSSLSVEDVEFYDFVD